MEKDNYKIYYQNNYIMENSNSVKVIGALLLGAAIGGGLGILFAPHKGSKTRKRIMSKGSDLSDAIQDKFEGFMEDVNEEVANIKHNLHVRMDGELAKIESPKKN
ncbi:MAG: YtxH domain-containing protein [Bacteroidia bacterium]|nr:YtxH domain-containing protein [Bacteroidia bacterium]